MTEYLDAVKPYIEYLKGCIQKSRDGIIRVRIKDLANQMKMTEKVVKLKNM